LLRKQRQTLGGYFLPHPVHAERTRTHGVGLRGKEAPSGTPITEW